MTSFAAYFYWQEANASQEESEILEKGKYFEIQYVAILFLEALRARPKSLPLLPSRSEVA